MVRRCLYILFIVARAAPGGAAAAGLLEPPVAAALLGLLGSPQLSSGGGSSAELQAAAAALLLQLCQEPGAAPQLAAAGAGPAFAAAASASGDSEASRLAAEALRSLQHQSGWGQHQRPVTAQRAASGRGPLPAHLPAPRWEAGLGRAASAPHPLPAVPEQQGVAGAAGAVPGWAADPRRASADHDGHPLPPLSNHARVQAWQQQHAPLQREEVQPAAQRTAPRSSGPLPLPPTGGSASVAHLVALLVSGPPRQRLAAAEQLGALAASGPRGAAVVSAAGGARALLACVSESAAAPVDIHDTLQNVLDSALAHSVCTAALRALCALCQQDAAAAPALPPGAAAGLRLVMAGPDPQQRQLAAMLLGCMQVAAAGPLPPSGSSQAGQPAEFGEAAWGASPDLLPSGTVSLLSELQPSANSLQLHTQEAVQQAQAPGDTPPSVLHRQQSTDTGGSASRAQQGQHGARRQLGSGLPPKPGSRASSAAGAAGGSQPPTPWQAHQGQLGGLWGRPQSGASAELASPFAGGQRTSTSDVFGSDATRGSLPSGAATNSGPQHASQQQPAEEPPAGSPLGGEGSSAGSEGPLLRPEDITLCRVGRSCRACMLRCMPGQRRPGGQRLHASAASVHACMPPPQLVPGPGCCRLQDAAGAEWRLGEGGFGVVFRVRPAW